MCNGTGKKKRKRKTTKNKKIRKIIPSLETYIDSGTVFHLCQQLTGGAYEKLVQIIGIGGNQASQRSGDFGTLKHAIEVPLKHAIEVPLTPKKEMCWMEWYNNWHFHK